MFTYGFKARGGLQVPVWAQLLVNYYWVIRVESRNKTKRRRYYRYVKAEKIRLAKEGISQIQIKTVCRYLCSFNKEVEKRLSKQFTEVEKQMSFDFYYDD